MKTRPRTTLPAVEGKAEGQAVPDELDARAEISTRPGLAWLRVVAIVVLWTFAVVASYYVVHKPFGVNNVVALLRTASDLVVWLFILVTATGLGWIAIRRMVGQATPLESLVLSCGLGLGMLSLLTLALGLAGALNRWLFWGLLLVLAAAGLGPLRDLVGRLRTAPLVQVETRFERLLLVYVILALIPAFLADLAPPIDWDSQLYHLAGPKLYIEAGRVFPTYNSTNYHPALGAMLYTTAMLLKSVAVAKLLHFGYLLLALLAVYALATRYLSRRAGLLGMAVLVSTPTLILVASWAYSDLLLVFYELATGIVILFWCDSRTGGAAAPAGETPAARSAATCPDNRLLVLTGVFTGLAMGVKYTAAMLPLALVTFVLWSSRRDGWRAAVRQVLLVGVSALLVSAPWFIKNWAFTGNPFYPFFLPGADWNEYRAWLYARPGTGLAPWRLLIAPWEATIYGIEGKLGYAATLGPLLLLTIPLLALTWKSLGQQQKRVVGVIAAICIPQYLFWLYGVATSWLLIQGRLLFPIFGLLAVLAGLAMDRLQVLDTSRFSVTGFMAGVLVIVLGLDLMDAGLRFAYVNPVDYLVGYQSADDYVRMYQPDYQDAIEYINTELPASAKLYFLWEPRSFYCQRENRPDPILDAFLDLRYRAGDAAAIDRYLRDEGYTHVLFHKRGLEQVIEEGFHPVAPADVAALREMQERYWTRVGEWGGAYELYELGR